MADFKKSRGFTGGARSQGFRPGGRPQGGRGGFGGPRGRSDDRPQMHDATCNECGNRCQVPFRPTGERPVYCSDCFGGKQDAPRNDFSRRDNSHSFDKPRSDNRSGQRPAAPSAPDARIDDVQHQLTALHKKVDALTALIEKAVVSAPQVAVTPAAEKTETPQATAKPATKKAAAKKVAKPAAKKKVAKKVAKKK